MKNIQINTNEAPEGFYAVLKSSVNREQTPNVCAICDARKLCAENKEGWCLENRCMSSGVVAFKDGKTYSRKDGASVFFRKKAFQGDLFGGAA